MVFLFVLCPDFSLYDFIFLLNKVCVDRGRVLLVCLKNYLIPRFFFLLSFLILLTTSCSTIFLGTTEDRTSSQGAISTLISLLVCGTPVDRDVVCGSKHWVIFRILENIT